MNTATLNARLTSTLGKLATALTGGEPFQISPPLGSNAKVLRHRHASATSTWPSHADHPVPVPGQACERDTLFFREPCGQGVKDLKLSIKLSMNTLVRDGISRRPGNTVQTGIAGHAHPSRTRTRLPSRTWWTA